MGSRGRRAALVPGERFLFPKSPPKPPQQPHRRLKALGSGKEGISAGGRRRRSSGDNVRFGRKALLTRTQREGNPELWN